MSDLLSCVEINADNCAHSVIWLHGLGADGHDFEPIVEQLNLNQAVRFIFPHAPEMPVTINNGYLMPAWYDIRSDQIDQLQDTAGIQQSQQAILQLIEREIERGIKTENIILAGFSQGGAIALHTGLRYQHTLAGIMGLSTYLPLAETLENEIHAANQNTPLFLAHGSLDPVVPFQLALATQQKLATLDYAVELKKYHMEHSVCPEEIMDISEWINQCFS